jgi:hypothetical protein
VIEDIGIRGIPEHFDPIDPPIRQLLRPFTMKSQFLSPHTNSRYSHCGSRLLRIVLGAYTLGHFRLKKMKNSTHTAAYTTIGTSVVKNCTNEGELVGAVGLVFRRGETEVELSLAEPSLGSALAFYRGCQRGNLLAPEGIVAEWDTTPHLHLVGIG